MIRRSTTRRRNEHGFVRHAHHLLFGLIGAFVVAAVVLGEMLDAYDAFWWWDDMLHGLSGVLFGLLGLGVIYAMNRRQELNVSPAFIVLFMVCFAVFMGVVWEIYEFIMDVTIHATMQQWNMGPNAIVMGKEYQGMGLRDTMSDLILATIGAIVTGLATYVAYRWRGSLLRRVMRWSFPLQATK
jgi:hypothetical protein